MGHVLKPNPRNKPFQTYRPLYLTQSWWPHSPAETGHLNWNLWHHSFSVGTGRCIFNEGQAEAGCHGEHVAPCGMLRRRDLCLCPQETAVWGEKGELVRGMGLCLKCGQWPATWWGWQTLSFNPSVHCSLFIVAFFPSDNKAFTGEKV